MSVPRLQHANIDKRITITQSSLRACKTTAGLRCQCHAYNMQTLTNMQQSPSPHSARVKQKLAYRCQCHAYNMQTLTTVQQPPSPHSARVRQQQAYRCQCHAYNMQTLAVPRFSLNLPSAAAAMLMNMKGQLVKSSRIESQMSRSPGFFPVSSWPV
ncbi:hypothetical protein PoB_000768800 [Plakobranchus ocellatus]|uniref:Uncharacterized protein n=1 Tax=Plakobranchus ocellatus TaxID=259542 RepID=A0AAV3YFD6_9GAST|nr:hypothetical protein PoB_000768800 [Plakobranchus ocellatus]